MKGIDILNLKISMESIDVLRHNVFSNCQSNMNIIVETLKSKGVRYELNGLTLGIQCKDRSEAESLVDHL